MITTVINKLIMYIAVCGLLPLVLKKTLFINLDKKTSEILNLINFKLNYYYFKYSIYKSSNISIQC